MSLQIKGKFIRLENGESLKILDSSGSEVSLIGLNGSDKVVVKGEEVAIKSVVDAAISTESSSREAEDLVLDGKITTERNRALAAESTLQSNIDAEETRALAAEAALQASITALESSVGTDLAQAIADLEADVAAESAARIAGDAATLASANSYTDEQVAALVNSAPEVLDTLKELADAINGDENFASTIAGQIGTVAANLAAEETRALAAEADLAADIAAETAARTAALSQVASAAQAAIQAETTTRMAADTALQGEIDAVEAGLAQEVLDRAAAVSTEEAARIAGDAGTLSSANSYTDTEVAVVQSEVDAVEASLAAEIANRIADVDTEESRALAAEAGLAADILAEETRAVAAEASLAADIAVLEARAHRKMKFVLSATDISNGYVTLGHEAMSKSTVASVGRLMIQEDDDYTVSVVGGVTRLTFIGSLVDPGNEKLAAGDVVFVKYMA
jgi:hypothetical protein